MLDCSADGDSVTFAIHVQPRASRAGIAGLHGDALKVRVTAPPEGGRANDEVVRVLADALGVPRSAVEILAGHTSRRKRVRVRGVTAEQVAARARLRTAAISRSGTSGSRPAASSGRRPPPAAPSRARPRP
ncbi:MAG: DUF167 domain-containing protein [Gemmatimonadota bacterium]